MEIRLWWSLLIMLLFFESIHSSAVNVALGKSATQTEDVFYNGWLWSADKAVDGCYDRDNPDVQQCCCTSLTTMGQPDNLWRVDLGQSYIIDRIVIYGRSDMDNQLTGFRIYYQDSGQEIFLYDDTGVSYGTGVFDIPISPPVSASSIIIRRPDLLTLCEVEVFQVESTTSTSVSTDSTATTSQGILDCPDGFYGPSCLQQCGQCAFVTTCDSATGDCAFGCNTGWSGSGCDTCADGYYGITCRRCGQCSGGTNCDKVDGICSFGCEPGWSQPRCDAACVSGTYGQDCALTCGNCDGGAPCNGVDGRCSSGCAPGWSGETCNQPEASPSPVTVSNIALGKPATQTEDVIWNGWTWSADKAVDGCTLRDSPDTQECCSTTQTTMGQTQNLWRVDLGQLYIIERIEIYGRTDTDTQLKDFQLYYVDGFSETLLYDNTGIDYADGYFVIPINPVRTADAIIIRRPSVLTLCEVEIFGAPVTTTASPVTTTTTVITGCPDGFYGPFCLQQCGQCAFISACDKLTGDCQVGCNTGWSGSRCDVCDDGYYGLSCQEQCGQCSGGTPCDKADGTCQTGCEPGFTTPICDQDCPVGFYGYGCSQACGSCAFGYPCNVVDGVCPSGCSDGWTGATCKDAETSTVATISSNVALGKPATQTEDVVWNGWTWSADKAVDGCALADDPDNQECCSTSQTTMGQSENLWRVFLQQTYTIERIVVQGRSDMDNQLTGFQLFYQDGSSETFLYDNTGVQYGSGLFDIPVNPPISTDSIIIRRPDTLTLCEVQVYAVTSTSSTPTSTSTASDTTAVSSTTAATSTNVALGKPATHTEDSAWNGWVWTADKAVDGCILADDPDNQYCCSTTQPTQGQPENLWRVFLGNLYTIDRIVIIGRSDMDVQLAGFQIFYDDGSSETFLYDDTGVEYGTGIFIVPINPPVTASSIIIRRPTVLTLCEVQVYGILAGSTSTSDTPSTGTSETPTPSSTSVSGDCPEGFWGASCFQSCGQCAVERSCDRQTGDCRFGCQTYWMPSRCDVCVDGNYGATCQQSCGWCTGGTACEKINGLCLAGCEPGWWGPRCDTACASGSYGQDCAQSCGNCDGGDSCDPVDGSCSGGCSPGYIGDTCSQSCSLGFYGYSCSQTCGNCAFGDSCNIIDGSCPSGCADGWTGATCHEQLTSTGQATGSSSTTSMTLTNVALGKPATHTEDSEWNGWVWTADKAVDGCILADDPDNQQCCSTSLPTQGQFENLWRVFLENLYIIYRIVIIGRSDMDSQLSGFQIYYFDGSSETFLDDDTGMDYGTGVLEIPVNPPITASAIIIRRPAILTLCEVQVYGILAESTTVTTTTSTTSTSSTPTSTSGDCQDGLWGVDCLQQCGHCAFETACDRVTGDCRYGCQTGWMPSACNVCTDGNYGPSCQQQCGRCRNGVACEKTNGFCLSGCDPGWTGPRCNTACTSGSYGQDCALSCGNCARGEPCNSVDGTCSAGCAPGYLGTTCSQACTSGNYGQNCAFSCGNCDRGETCDPVDGGCTSGCAPGYVGMTCSQACPAGYYGYGCSQSCGNCALGASCNIVNGVCPAGCDNDWTGATCHEPRTTTTTSGVTSRTSTPSSGVTSQTSTSSSGMKSQTSTSSSGMTGTSSSSLTQTTHSGGNGTNTTAKPPPQPTPTGVFQPFYPGAGVEHLPSFTTIVTAVLIVILNTRLS